MTLFRRKSATQRSPMRYTYSKAEKTSTHPDGWSLEDIDCKGGEDSSDKGTNCKGYPEEPPSPWTRIQKEEGADIFRISTGLRSRGECKRNIIYTFVNRPQPRQQKRGDLVFLLVLLRSHLGIPVIL